MWDYATATNTDTGTDWFSCTRLGSRCVCLWDCKHTHTLTRWLLCRCIRARCCVSVCVCEPLVFLTHLSARVLFVSTALLCSLRISVLGWSAEGWSGKATIQMERRFLWWCSVGEQERGASWRETGIEDHKHNTTQINRWRAERATTWAGYIKHFCFDTKIKPLLCFLQIA